MAYSPCRDFTAILNDAPDWSSPQARAEALLPLALAQLGAADADWAEWVRLLALRTVREVVPIALRAYELDEDLTTACEQAEDLTQADNAAFRAFRAYAKANESDEADGRWVRHAAEDAAEEGYGAARYAARARAFAAEDAARAAVHAARANNSDDALRLAARIAVECLEATRS